VYCLEKLFIFDRSEGFCTTDFGSHDASGSGLNHLAFKRNPDSFFLGPFPGSIIHDHSAKEVLSATRFLNMFDTDVESLLHNSISDSLVNFHTNCVLGHVPYNTSSTVVEFVGHTLVNRTVHFNIHHVSELEGRQIFGKWYLTMLFERPRKEMPCLLPVTFGVRHDVNGRGWGCPTNSTTVELVLYGT